MFLAEIDIDNSIQRTLDDIGGFLPNLVGALAILLIGWFVARIVFRAVKRILSRLKFDQLVDRSGIGAPLERAGFADSGEFLARVVYWLLMFIVLKMTVETLGIDALQNLVDDLVNWLPKLVVALILVFITGAVANFVRGIVSGATSTESWGNAATNVAVIGVWFIGAMAALDQIEVAADIVDTLFTVVISALAGMLVIKFGVGGIWAARDRFWPSVYDRFGAATTDTSSD